MIGLSGVCFLVGLIVLKVELFEVAEAALHLD